MEQIKNMDIFIERYLHMFIDFLPNLLVAGLILIAGIWLIRLINKMVAKFFRKKKYDPSLKVFVGTLIKWSLRILLFVVVVTQLGIKSASLVAIIGSAGLTIGLALQGSLANFAGGVLILVLKPFRVGDWISAQGVEGTVTEINVFNTKIATFGNQLAVVPNGKLSNDKVVNYNALPIRRNSITVGIGYDENIKAAKDLLLQIVMNQEETLKEEGRMPMVAVAGFGENYLELTLRFWARNSVYWDLNWKVHELIISEFEAAGISIPFPQRDVFIKNYKEN